MYSSLMSLILSTGKSCRSLNEGQHDVKTFSVVMSCYYETHCRVKSLDFSEQLVLSEQLVQPRQQ